MNPWLHQFSDWTLALLPRLLLYPGGVWALGALLALRFSSGGLRSVGLRGLAGTLLRAHRLSAAAAWAALALLPLPGAAPLPFPADRLSLVLLLLASLAFDRSALGNKKGQGVNVALALAAMAPLVGGRTLLPAGGSGGVSGWLALAAAGVGLALLWETSARELAGGLRWLAWLGLAAAPVWAALPGALPGPLWVSAVYLLFIVTTAALGSWFTRRGSYRGALVTCWALGALALLAALLAQAG